MDLGPAIALVKNSESAALVAAPRVTGITVDKSVEFSYEELAKATNDFSMGNKIGQGGFGAVFYAELRGEVCIWLITAYLALGMILILISVSNYLTFVISNSKSHPLCMNLADSPFP